MKHISLSMVGVAATDCSADCVKGELCGFCGFVMCLVGMEDGGIVLPLFRDFDGDLWVVCCVEASLAGGAGALDLFSWVPVLIAVRGVMKHHSRWVSGGFPKTHQGYRLRRPSC